MQGIVPNSKSDGTKSAQKTPDREKGKTAEAALGIFSPVHTAMVPDGKNEAVRVLTPITGAKTSQQLKNPDHVETF